MPRPNILYIHSHDTGRYIQPYGHGQSTPNLQRLAEQSVLFRNAHCAAPTCSPSRSALLTGQCPHSNGMLGLAHRGFTLNDPSHHLASFLTTQGYRTVLCGLQHEAKDPKTLGYSQILPTKSVHVPDVTPVAEKFLDGRPSGPFLLTVGYFETHRLGDKGGVFTPQGPAGDPRYFPPPAPLPELPDIQQDMADFSLATKTLDDGVGRVLAALDRNGLADNTLVISTTDHGISFPDMKCNLTDHGSGVSLMLRYPGTFGRGEVCHEMVSHLDVFPTICELCRITPPPWLQGKSLLNWNQDSTTPIHDALFGEVNYHAAYEPQRAVRTSRWKYIRRYDPRDRRVVVNCDDGLSKSAMLKFGWDRNMPGAEQLYDLVFDPNEENNCAADPRNQAVLQDLRNRLDNWMKSTDDPLLRGPPVLPKGAYVNSPDEISAHEHPK